jgi:hypothetical protein
MSAKKHQQRNIISSMTTEEATITPLELAHLSTAMTQAGLIKDRSSLDAAGIALNYLKAHEEALKLADEAAQQKRANNDAFDRMTQFLQDYADFVPVETIVTFHQAQNFKLTADEMIAIGERRAWEKLDRDERINCIFLMLTNKQRETSTHQIYHVNEVGFRRSAVPRRSVKPTKDLATRKQWLETGVPFSDAQTVVELIAMAKAQRPTENGKEGERKRRKPRAPKGDDGQFQKKGRGLKGHFKK